MADPKVDKSTYDKFVDGLGAAGDALKGQYENVKGFLDVNKDGKIYFDDAKEGFTKLSTGVQNAAKSANQFLLGDGENPGFLQKTWDGFKKDPVNYLMAGAGALLFGLLFAEGGFFTLVLAAIAGAVAFGGLSTYINQHNHPDAAPAATPGTSPQPEAGNAPAVAASPGLVEGKNLETLLADKKIDRSEMASLPDGHVLLTPEYKSPTDIGPVIYAKQDGDKLTNVQVALSGDNRSLVKLDGEFSMQDQAKIMQNARSKLDTAPAKPEDVSVDEIQAPLLAAVEANKKAATPAAGK